MRLPAAVLALLLNGCLYTTHHFNTGRLLEPGHSAVTLGYGRSSTVGYGCPDGLDIYDYSDSTGLHCERYNPFFGEGMQGQGEDRAQSQGPDTLQPESKSSPISNGSIGYRLGIHDRFGPFTGAEIGLHLEAPTNPASAEFDLKLGLPLPQGIPYHHSLSAGWGIGAWADNSWFLEYAASRAFGGSDLFVNYRADYLSTQVGEITSKKVKNTFRRHPRWIHQAAFGFRWALPKIAVVPDFLIPQIGLNYPQAPVGESDVPAFVLDDRMWSFALGMGWGY
ncbi:MAG: hypothetical protein ABI036_02390 [Fibrobacteria bacterium]